MKRKPLWMIAAGAVIVLLLVWMLGWQDTLSFLGCPEGIMTCFGAS